MINRVVLVGRLTKDADLRYTSSGVAVSSFSLAVDRQYTNQNGERETDFINCIIWRKAAENFSKFTHKGSLVAIEGRLQTRSYENQQGNRIYVTEVIIDNFSLLETKSQAEQYRRDHPNSNYNRMELNEQNVKVSSDLNNDDSKENEMINDNHSQSSSTMNRSEDPFDDHGEQVNISDDDLPF